MRTSTLFRVFLLSLVLLGVNSFVTLAADLPNPYSARFSGQCTWYAAERRADLRFNTGDAYQWAATSEARGYTVNTTPSVGAIAVWDQWKAGAVEQGHVAYVIRVDDATHFRVAEYNWDVELGYGERDVTWVDGIRFIQPQGSVAPVLPDPRVSYVIGFNPTVAQTGARVQITVGATDTAGNRATQSIQVSVDGNPIGTINGASGSLSWNTSGVSAGAHTIQARASLQNWSNNVNTQQVSYVLQSAPAAPSSGGPDPWSVGWLPSDRARVVAAIETIITSPETGGSPSAGLKGYGAAILNYALASVEGNPAGVNPAFALAMFRKEANYATYGAAPANNNPGNIICANGTRPLYGAVRCNGRFGVYASMDAGIRAYFWLLQAEYKPGGAISRNCPDIPCIIRAYAPDVENNTNLYISQVSGWTSDFQNRISNGAPPPAPSAEKPALANPGNGANLPATADVTLTWNAARNATQYKVQLWGGPYSTMTPCDWQAGTTCRIGVMRAGTMQWKVIARGADGREIESDTWSFGIAQIVTPTWTPTITPTSAPQVVNRPGLANPGNGATLPQSAAITLAWNSSPNATQYKVEVWGGAYSTMTPCNWQAATSCAIGTMWPGTMQWHVKARNASGQESDWSDTWSFTIQANVTPTWTPTPPPASANRPALSSPGNGATMPQSTDVTLMWNSSANATQYKVEVWGGPYSTMTPCNWQSGTSCRIGQMWSGTMQWHVKARNASGQESDWSDTWSFTIQNIVTPTWTPTKTTTPLPPSAGRPSLSSPGNGATMPQSTDVTLVWNSSANATQYKVEVWGGPYSTMTPCNWQSGTSCRIGQMWSGTMQWHVKARNASGQESDWSDTWSFTIQNIVTPTWTPTSPPASPGRVVITQGLVMSPGSPSAGQNVNAKFTAQNIGGQPVTFRFFGVKGRHSSGAAYDYLWLENFTLQPGQSFTYDVNRALDRAGSYTFTPNYSPDGANWSDLKFANGSNNYVTLTVR